MAKNMILALSMLRYLNNLVPGAGENAFRILMEWIFAKYIKNQMQNMFWESGKDVIFSKKKIIDSSFWGKNISQKDTWFATLASSQQKYLNGIEPMKSSCFSHFTVYFNTCTEYYTRRKKYQLWLEMNLDGLKNIAKGTTD